MEDRETDDAVSIAREEGDLRYGVFITPAGLEAIGLGKGEGAGSDVEQPTLAQPASKRQTKSAIVIALLQREEGAMLAELIAATGRLPHTTRATLTGLRKKAMRSNPAGATPPPATALWWRADHGDDLGRQIE